MFQVSYTYFVLHTSFVIKKINEFIEIRLSNQRKSCLSLYVFQNKNSCKEEYDRENENFSTGLVQNLSYYDVTPNTITLG